MSKKPDTLDVKALRERLGWSQNEFARFLGVSVNTVARWEADTRHARGASREHVQALDHATRSKVGADHIPESALQGATMRSFLHKALSSDEEK